MNLTKRIKEKRFEEHKKFYAQMRDLELSREKKKEYFKEAFNYFLGIECGIKNFYKEAFKEIKEKELKGKDAANELCEIRKREIADYCECKAFNKSPVCY